MVVYEGDFFTYNINKKILRVCYMLRILGFAMFFVAIGIFIGIFITTRFWEIFIIILLLIVGYYLFTAENCKKK